MAMSRLRISGPARSPASAPPTVATGLRLQRACACGGRCPDCAGNRRLQRSAVGPVPGPFAPSIVHDVLAGAGRPLPAEALAWSRSALRRDFSHVRVHTDGRAAESARSVGAMAYTVGDRVVFGAGRFAPGTAGGRRLLAHELAHVVQQGGAVASWRPGTPLPVGRADDPAEAEADRAAMGAEGAVPGIAADGPVLRRSIDIAALRDRPPPSAPLSPPRLPYTTVVYSTTLRAVTPAGLSALDRFATEAAPILATTVRYMVQVRINQYPSGVGLADGLRRIIRSRLTGSGIPDTSIRFERVPYDHSEDDEDFGHPGAITATLAVVPIASLAPATPARRP